MIRDTALAFLFVSLFLSMPAGSYGQTQPVIAETFTTSGCPVIIRAQYSPGARLVPVGPAAAGERREPLRLYFSPDITHKIVHAQISVRGISVEGGILPANAGHTSPWIVKTFDLDITEDSQGKGRATVWLSDIGGVAQVRLNSLTYDDGSTWTSSEQKTCYAVTGAVLTAGK